VREAELFVALDVERRAGPEAVVRLASAIEPRWLEALFPGSVVDDTALVFDPERGRVVERIRTRYHDLVLTERIGTDVDRAAAGAVLAAAVEGDPSLAASDDDTDTLRARLRFLARAMPELGWPDPDAVATAALLALCAGRASLAELRKADLRGAIQSLLTLAQRTALAREAPDTWRLPSGRTVQVAYPAGRPPVVAARIQELFGLAASPRAAAGRVAFVFELLAPSGRPVQVTDDLASFWRTTYPEVRKVLRGRYPKHAWPDDPTRATPDARPRRRGA